MLCRKIDFNKLPPIKNAGSVAGWKQVPIKECAEKMVPLGPFSTYSRIALQDSIYWGERISSLYRNTNNLEGGLLTPFARIDVAKRLVKAASLLPAGHRLLIWDAYRTLQVQQALFDHCVSGLMDQNNLTKDAAILEAQKYVSLPSTDSTKPSPHNTGAVVDCTIIRLSEKVQQKMCELERQLKSKDWQIVFEAEMQRLQIVREQSEILDMGTQFDEASVKTNTTYYEFLPEADLRFEDVAQRNNRRLLYWVMTQVGFASYEEEWWHFSYGDQFWAVKRGVPAVYGAGNFDSECEAWERMRCDHFIGCSALRQRSTAPGKVSYSQLRDFVKSIAQATGDLSFSAHPKVAAL